MLYHIQYDHQPYYVEAPTIADAVIAWKDHVKEDWGADYDETEEPESIALVHGEAVIRATVEEAFQGQRKEHESLRTHLEAMEDAIRKYLRDPSWGTSMLADVLAATYPSEEEQ